MTPDAWVLVHVPTGARIASVSRADGWWAKGWGVIGWPALSPGHGLWMPGVAAVHTVFVQFPLDLLFLDKAYRTVRLACGVPPGKLLIRAKACHTIELGAGTFTPETIAPGDPWELIPASSLDAGLTQR